MSARLLQFASKQSTRVVRVNAIPLQWTALDPSLGGSGFLRSWLLDDQKEQGNQRRHRWAPLGGLALAFAISAGFWAGLGLLISRFV